MRFLRSLFGKKTTAPATSTQMAPGGVPDPGSSSARAVQKPGAAGIDPDFMVEAGDTAAGVNIWDFDGDAPPKAGTKSAPEATAGRPRRNKTRIIGFESSNTEVVSLFEAAQSGSSGPAIVPSDIKKRADAPAKLPVGFVIVTDGPGRGTVLHLHDGRNTVGTAKDAGIRLDFGDAAIAAANHAAITFQDGIFLLEQGDKSKVTRLNRSPLVDATALNSGDVIRMGETSLRFLALCGDDFDWTSQDATESENVATA